MTKCAVSQQQQGFDYIYYMIQKKSYLWTEVFQR